MYQQFFNFSEAPFTIAPDPHFIYMSSRHQEGLAHLLYGINYGGGFVVLTGEVGTGKTTLCQCLLQQLPDKVDIAMVLNSKLGAVDLLATICDELSVPHDNYRRTRKHLVDNLNHYLLATHAKGRRTVLMIDEAQNLSFDVLEQIRLLTNLETHKSKLLQIILVGQPELKQLLASSQLRQLNQRITARYHLLPLSETETRHYIQHRLTVSHGDPAIFKQAAIHRVYQLSSGIPRLINLICDRALLGAYASNSRKVTTTIINRAAREIDNSLLTGQSKKRLITLIVLFLCSCGLAVYYHLLKPLVDKPIKRLPVVATVEKQPVKKLPPHKTSEVLPVTIEQAQLVRYLQQSELTLQKAFDGLLRRWELPAVTQPDCAQLPLNCLAEKSSWPELIALQRPAILEFPVNNNEKRFLLLIAVENGQPVFANEKNEISFPLPQVLSLWQGNYMLLWQSPHAKVEAIYPHQQSPAVVWLREQLDLQEGVSTQARSADYFDDTLQARVLAFQQSQQLRADGIAGPRTMIHLQNHNNIDNVAKLKITD